MHGAALSFLSYSMSVHKTIITA